jgi:hypothetical protein
MTPSGIEPATFRLVAHRVPHSVYVRGQNVLKYESEQLLRHVGLLYFQRFVRVKLSWWINAPKSSGAINHVKT